MRLNGGVADEEVGGYLAVGHSLGNEKQYLTLTGSQLVESRWDMRSAFGGGELLDEASGNSW